MAVNNLLEAALSYQKSGFSVIPLQPGGKKPLARWEDFSRRRASEEEIVEWWKKTPTANIGIVTGEISGVVAIDIDTHRGGNAERVFEIAPTDLISKTGGGGYHLLYRYDTHIDRNKVGKNGVDVRSNGGYIVVPPSTHASGNDYQWIKTGNVGNVTKSLVSYINLPQVSTDSETPRWLSDALLGVIDGSRNDTCAKLIGYYAGKGIPKDVALIMMLNWDANNSPPLGGEVIQTSVDSVYRTSYKRSPLPEAHRDAETFNIMGMSDFMVEYGAQAVSWVIPDWLPQGTIAFIASPPGTFKTWILLDLAISVASGTPFLNKYPVESAGPVLMIQQEDHQGGLAERMGVIMNSRYHMLYPNTGDNFCVNTPPDIPLYFHPDRKLRFNDKIIMDKLEEVIEKLRPRLVIVDPLYSAAETEDYMAKSATDMLRLKGMRDKYGCSFVIAHHKKKNSENNEREGLWGSQFLNAFLETGWQIRSTGDASVSVRRHFKVKKESTELTIEFGINTEDYPYKYEMDIRDTASGEKEIDIVAYLEDSGPKTIAEIAEVLGLPKAKAATVMTQLSNDHVVTKSTSGRFSATSNEKEF